MWCLGYTQTLVFRFKAGCLLGHHIFLSAKHRYMTTLLIPQISITYLGFPLSSD